MITVKESNDAEPWSRMQTPDFDGLVCETHKVSQSFVRQSSSGKTNGR
jgi:hypothetical protein